MINFIRYFIKKNVLSVSFIIFYLSIYGFSFSQGTWVQKSNFGGVPRAYTVGFSIGNKGYIGVGQDLNNSYNDFWEWDQVTNVWTQKANYPGSGVVFPVGFSIGNKGYVGTGADNSQLPYKDFWEWDQATNVWTQKANFGGTSRWLSRHIANDVRHRNFQCNVHSALQVKTKIYFVLFAIFVGEDITVKRKINF